MRLKLLACEILYRECCAAVARSVNAVDVEFLPKGLHDIGQAGMSARLGQALTQIDPARYEAILLGYGLCSNALVGLAAQPLPLVVARAHDCITLLLGSKERYLDYFQSHPGVYFKTSGWIERGESGGGLSQFSSDENGTVPLSDTIQQQAGMTLSLEELTAKYGPDNAQFLYEQLGNMLRNYNKMTFIEMGIEPDGRFEQAARDEAGRRGWQFEALIGDMRLIQDLVDGPWDDDRYLVVPPGSRIAPSFDDKVIKAVRDDGHHA